MATASGGLDYGPQDQGSRFRGLDDYTEYPEIQTKKKRHSNNNDVIDPKTGFIVCEKMFAEFYIMELIDNNNSFERISPFFIEKALTSYIGQQHETKRLRNGSLLIKCKNEKQAKLLLNYNNILFGNTYKVKVTEHSTLNTVQGMIYCWDSKYLSEEEILEGLTDQKVVGVRKIKKKVGDAFVDTALCILTFKRSLLPSSIKFGFHSVLVKPYIPNPLRCLNCFRFGHTRKNCKRERVCAHCSDLFHEPDMCKTGSRCINCKGAHTNWNKECPQFVRELGIQTIKIQEKIPYFEAKKKYDSFPNAQHLRINTNMPPKPTYTQAITNLTQINDNKRPNTDHQHNTTQSKKQQNQSSNMSTMTPPSTTHNTVTEITSSKITTNLNTTTSADTTKNDNTQNKQIMTQPQTRNNNKITTRSQKSRNTPHEDRMQSDSDNSLV